MVKKSNMPEGFLRKAVLWRNVKLVFCLIQGERVVFQLFWSGNSNGRMYR